MIKTTILFFAIFIFNSFYSQSNHTAYPHVTPLSPNAAQLAKFGDYPVSHYTGVPNISVPIYEINVDGLNIPISLNYHASGIRTDQEATWVGLGWSMSSIFTISRTANFTDDLNDGTIGVDQNYPHINKGYYYAPDIHPVFLDNQYYKTVEPVFCGYPTPLQVMHNLECDTQPDIFYYNLPEINGKFLLDKSRGAVLLNKEHNLKFEIERIATRAHVEFTVRDKYGNKYLFDKIEITKTYTDNTPLNKNIHDYSTKYDDLNTNFTYWYPFDSGCDPEYEGTLSSPYPMITSWYLSKIITPNGKEVTFSYGTQTQILPTQESCENYSFEDYPQGLFYYKSKNVITGLYLKSINWDSGSVTFITSPREDIRGDSNKLHEISIKDRTNKIIKSFKLNYSYFNDDYSGKPIYSHVFKRLKLDTLIEYTSDNLPLNTGYKFDYFEGNFPPKNSKDVDYWGFQNGKKYGDKYYIGISISNGQRNYSGVKKDMNFDKAIIGTLKSIHYPTGGFSEFKFESNKMPSGYFEANTYEPISPSNSTFIDLPVYNYFSIYPPFFENLPPLTDKYSFSIDKKATLKVTCDLENQNGLADPDYTYKSFDKPFGILRKIDSNSSSSDIYKYECPYIFDSSVQLEPPYGPYGEGVEISLLEKEFSLEPGTYEFIAKAPPRDVVTNWRLFLRVSDTPVIGDPLMPYDAGGIRISEIKTEATTRKFNYYLGMMISEPKFYYFGYRDPLPKWIGSALVQVSESKTPLSTFVNGNFIGYDWVEEIFTDEKGKNFKSKYYFHNTTETEVFDDNFANPPRLHVYTNGLIKSIEKYDENSIVEQTDYFYSSTFSRNVNAFIDNLRKRKFLLDPQEFFDSRKIAPFYYKFEWPQLAKKIKTIKTNVGDIISSENYKYNDFGLKVLNTAVFSDNSVTELSTKYPSEKNNRKLIDANMIGIPLETTVLRKKDSLDMGNLISKIETIYPDQNNYPTAQANNLLLPLKTNMFDLQSNTNSVDEITYDKYDASGNLLQYTVKNGFSTAIIWGYNQTQPIAKIEGVGYAALMALPGIPAIITDLQSKSAADVDDDTENTLITALDSFRTNSHLTGFKITTYTYNPLIGVTSITPPSGIREIYTYDTANRLQEVKDVNGNILKEYKYNYKQ